MESIHDKLITIYSKNDSSNNYNTQGLGALPDFTSAKVEGKLNGGEFFTGVYPVDGVNADKIVNDNIILTFIDEERPRQRMRIYNTNKELIEGMITFNAEPIFSDIRRHVAHYYNSNAKVSASSAFEAVKTIVKPQMPSRFKFISTVTTSAQVEIEKFNMLEFFGGKEGSILDRFKGEFRRDNNTLYHMPRIGEDHKMSIIYSKNLTGLELEVDSSNIVIGILPYISGDDDSNDILLPEVIILTEFAEMYPNGKIEFVDFKDKATTVDELRSQANNWLVTNADKTKPVIGGNIEMLPLKHIQGYEQFVQLNTVALGDGVDVYHPLLDTVLSARIVEYTYNCLTDSYDSLKIGQLKSNFLDQMNNTIDNIINDVINDIINGGNMGDIISDMIDHQTDLITGNAGGYVVLDPKEQPSRILIMDTPNKDTARNVLQLNQNGIGFSKTGINGTYDTAWTLDGGFNASFITAGILKAINIEGVTIKGSTFETVNGSTRTTLEAGRLRTWYNNVLFSELTGNALAFFDDNGKRMSGFSRSRNVATGELGTMVGIDRGYDFSLSTKTNNDTDPYVNRIQVDGTTGDVTISGTTFTRTGDYQFTRSSNFNNWEIKKAQISNSLITKGTDFTVHNNVNFQVYSDINMNGFSIRNQSDIRLKENIKPSDIDPIKETSKLDFYEFNRKTSYKNRDGSEQPNASRELGLIAQHTPFLATQDSNTHYLSIDTSKQIMLNSMTNKALIERITQLESKLNSITERKNTSNRKYHRNR